MGKSVVHKTVLWLSYVIGGLLLLSYASSVVSPAVTFLPSLLNLFFIPLLVTAFILLFFSFLFKVKHSIFFLIVVLLFGISRYKMYFSINTADYCEEEAKTFRLMTYNVKVFNLYDWVKNVHYKQSIMSVIDSVSPDILCLQEYVYDDRGIFNTRDTILTLLGYKYYNEYFNARNKYFHFGTALFSRFPIISTEPILFKESKNFVVKYKIVLPGSDTVCLFNVHFESIRFSDSEYKYLDSIKNNLEENKIEGLFPIMKKLKKL